ncbi:MAG: CBS domain-containing protein [Deltaproteobacteria bacterium]|nr:CBS domain-containing protein [Deltaproteobacteria bacterium]
MSIMIAANIMTVGLSTVSGGTTVREALRIFRDTGTSRIPVVDHGKRVIGAVTTAGILAAVFPAVNPAAVPFSRIFERFRECASKDVCDVMEMELMKVSPETPVSDIAALILNAGIRGVSDVMVVDGNGILLGVISAGDVIERLDEYAG